MALDAISGTVYHDVAKVAVQKTEGNTADKLIQESPVINMNVTEAPAPVRAANGNQSQNDTDKGQKDPAASAKQLKNAISRVNSKLKVQRTKCEFSYNEETKRVSIKVYDQDTKEVIREIPPEETQEMVEKMWELAGLLVDEKR